MQLILLRFEFKVVFWRKRMLFMWYFKTEPVRVKPFVLINFTFAEDLKRSLVLAVVDLG